MRRILFSAIMFVLSSGFLEGQAKKPVTHWRDEVSAEAGLAGAIQPDEYRERRSRVLDMMDSTSALAMKAVDNRVRSNDVNYRYRQESNFLYLTGINEPSCYLVMIPRGMTIEGRLVTTVVLVPPQNALLSETPFPGDAFISSDRVQSILDSALDGTTTLYVSAPDLGFKYDWISGSPIFIDRDVRKKVEASHSGLKWRPAANIIVPVRMVKSEREIGLIQRAINITGSGLARAISTCKPGIWEFELQAEIEYEMTRLGAEYQSFPSIIGSGTNSLILHYDENRRQTHDGDLVVMDVGAEYFGYAADVTRTIPISGTFSAAQAEVYSVVLRAQQETVALIRPGVSFNDLDAHARSVIASAGFGSFIRHGVSHPVGLDVHDVTKGLELKPGMVITVEPGIYIPSRITGDT